MRTEGAIVYNTVVMLFRKLMEKVKKLNRARVLAIAFLVLIFYVGSDTLPMTMLNIGNAGGGIQNTAEQIDNNYRNMLGYDKSNLRNKGVYINLNGMMARLVGQREMNERFLLDNGHLSRVDVEKDVELAITQMTKLCEAQKEKGKEFLFVLTPTQVPKYEDVLPYGLDDATNINGDNLIEGLKDNNVPVLDLREKMHEEGISNTDAMFVTDHHWKPETAFWAHTKILEYFEENGIVESIDETYTNIANYNVEILENHYLGVAGQRTGIYYAGTDDFAIIYPKFDTEIELKIPYPAVEKTGAFRDVVFSGQERAFDYFKKLPYNGYGYGRREFKSFRNEKAPLDLKVLSIGDSFLPPVNVFLSLSVKSLDEMDMSAPSAPSAPPNKEDFLEYYSDYEPDIIIVLIYARGVEYLNATYDYFNDLS